VLKKNFHSFEKLENVIQSLSLIVVGGNEKKVER